jgi:hypothetical protein
MPKSKQTDLIMAKAEEIREIASGIMEQASLFEALSKGLKKANKGDFLVFEATNNVTMPVQMGIYEGVSGGLLGDFTIGLNNPAYLIKDSKTGDYCLHNDRVEQLYHAIVVDSIIRNIAGKLTIPTVHREQRGRKGELTADEVLHKYGCSVEQYRKLCPDEKL